jgi:hypothetical protein
MRQRQAGGALRILEPMMWYGYAIEAIYIVLGTALIPIMLGVLIYQ